MEFRVIDLIAKEKAASIDPSFGPSLITTWVSTQNVKLEDDEVGIILQKKKVSEKGVIVITGMVHSGWYGPLSLLTITPSFHLIELDKPIAHLLILKK